MPDTKRLIVHLGYHRAGSALLQTWLVQNALALDGAVHVLNAQNGGTGTLAEATLALSRGSGSLDAVEAAARGIAEQLHERPEPVIVMSDERLLGLPLGYTAPGFLEAAIYPRAYGIVDRLSRAFSSFSTEFMVIERGRPEWLRQMHDLARTQGWFAGNLEAFRTAFDRQIDWDALGSEIVAAAGGRSAVVRFDLARDLTSGEMIDSGPVARLDLPDAVVTACRAGPLAQSAYALFLKTKPGAEALEDADDPLAMNRRLAQSDAFKARPHPGKSDLGAARARIVVSKGAHMLFLPIPGVLPGWLKAQVIHASHHPHADYLLQDLGFLTETLNTGLHLEDYPRPRAEAILDDPALPLCAVLRDPKARLLSAYETQFVRNRSAPSQQRSTRATLSAVQDTGTPDFETGVSFRDFVGQVIETPDDKRPPLWRSQAQALDGLPVARICALDRVDHFLAFLEKRAKITLDRKVPLPAKPGPVHDGAADALPGAFDGAPWPSQDSFFDASLSAAVDSAFASDYALLDKSEDFDP